MAPLAHSKTKALKLGHVPTKNTVARERNQATGYRQRKGKFEIYKARKFEISKRDFESARKIFRQYCNFCRCGSRKSKPQGQLSSRFRQHRSWHIHQTIINLNQFVH